MSKRKLFSTKRLSIKEKVKSIAQDIKDIKWHVELLTSILTGFVIVIISTVILGTITYFSPGEYTGERLEKYLLETISHEIGIEYSEGNISISRALYGIQNGTNITDSIVLCGEYATDDSYLDLFLNGHYICIFERAPRNFFNDLFRTESKYIPVFIRIADPGPNSWGTAPDALMCLSCETVDIDSDGFMEISVQYSTSFADRTSKLTFFIEHVNSSWKIVSPDFSTLKEELCTIANKDVYPGIDDVLFINPQNSEENDLLYSLSNYGYFIPDQENIFSSKPDILYCIRVTHFIDNIRCYSYAYVMEQFYDNEMVREPDWNLGSIYFPQYEERKIEEFVADLWGWSIGKEYNTPWSNWDE